MLEKKRLGFEFHQNETQNTTSAKCDFEFFFLTVYTYFLLQKTTEVQYSKLPLKQARLVSSLLYGARAMLLFNLLAFEIKKNAQLVTVSMETFRMARS